MLWGVDSAYPGNPSLLTALGYTFAMGYIGGNAANVWAPSDWSAHNDEGLLLGAIWVAPYGDPSYQQGVDEANAALAALSLNSLGGAIFHDVENGLTPGPYMEAFTTTLRRAGSLAIIYGSDRTLEASAGLYDEWWLAHWPTSGAAIRKAPSDWAKWQFAIGQSFNYNVALGDSLFTAFT